MTPPTPYLDRNGCRLYVGDALATLRQLPDASVQMCVTSPPYFGLRRYLDPADPAAAYEIGLEARPDDYLAHLVAIFAEVRRVLRPDGTLWLNIGSSFSSGKGANLPECLNSFLEGGSIFVADAETVTVAPHRVHVASNDKRAPDGILPGLLGSQRHGVEDRNQNLCKIGDALAAPADSGIGATTHASPMPDGSDASHVTDEADQGLIVRAHHNGKSQPELGVFRTAARGAGKYNEASLSVNDTDEPGRRNHVRWYARWDAFASYAISKGIKDFDLVDDTVSLRDRPNALAGLLRDFRVTEASAQQFTLTSIERSLSLTISDVRHARFILSDGSLVPYVSLYQKASRLLSRLRPKQDLAIPFRLAIALQEDGWILRSSVIWYKRNCLPESVTDRPTTAHEHVFLLAKQPRYFYDAQAIAEPHQGHATAWRLANGRMGGTEENGPKHAAKVRAGIVGAGAFPNPLNPAGRNSRSVWDIPPTAFTTAHLDVGAVEHFAAFPLALAARCIRAGSSEAGCCAACGAPWERVTERTTMEIRRTDWGAKAGNRTAASGTMLRPPTSQTTGWRPTCACPTAPPVPCTILEPFAGSGTTLRAAQELGRRAVGIELSPEYARIIEARVGRQGQLDFAAPAEQEGAAS